MIKKQRSIHVRLRVSGITKPVQSILICRIDTKKQRFGDSLFFE